MISPDFIKPVNVKYIDINKTGNSSAQVLFLVHGSSSTKETWSPIIEPLKRRFRMIAVDLRGHGDNPMFLDFRYSIEEMVEDIHVVVKKLKLKKIIFVAHSMGVKIVIPYAAKYSDRVKGLILEDLVVAPAKKPKLTIDQVEKLKMFKTEHPSLEKAKAELRKFGYSEARIESYSLDGRIERKENGTARIKIHPYVRYIIRSLVMSSHEPQDSFRKITRIPKILILADQYTYASDEDVAEMQEIDPGLQVIKILESNHSVHSSQTEEFMKVLNKFVKTLR